jgi:2,4-dienoyl-CoA reductase (NADPH2)
LEFFEKYEEGKLDEKKEFVVIGEDIVACDLVDFLSRKGKSVTVVTKMEVFPHDVEGVLSYYFLEQFSKRNVKIITHSVIEKFDRDSISLMNKDEKKILSVKADCVVFANTRKSFNGLAEEISDLVSDVHVIGDAKEPRLIIDAVREGFITGMNL